MITAKNEQTLAALLYERKCPFDYRCLSTDCMECVKMQMEKGRTNGKE
jgi:hypothetical protein